MQLIGMLDSPYVRRVAISMRLLGLPFEHRPVSVFRHFAEFSAVNPVVKAPSLVCDDGAVLMDSTLILDHAEQLARMAGARSLMPEALQERRDALRVIGLALAACEKTMQIVYERSLRPAERQHEPWVERVQGQLAAAHALLDQAVAAVPLAVDATHITQAGVTAAVAWSFTQMMLPGAIDANRHAAIASHARAAESTPDFIAAPTV